MCEVEQKLSEKELSALRLKIREEQAAIRADLVRYGNLTPPRTEARNIKFPAASVEEEYVLRQGVVDGQLSTWKKLLPQILKRFAKIPDPRRPKSVKHRVAVLLMHALLMFIFRFKSRKAINNELSKPQFHKNLRLLFPEIDSIPHGDTVSRLMARIDPTAIEKITIAMIKGLIKKKAFKNFLINGCLPISIDGVQKLSRNGALQAPQWLERTVKSENGLMTQQYVAILEANITLSNGLSIPLLSEFLFYDGNASTKQDCELTGFKRLASTLKSYFKRQKIIVCLDKLYACEPVLDIINANNWQYLIVLPAKLSIIDKQLKANKEQMQPIPGQHYYNGREQQWYWKNGIDWRDMPSLNAVACFEKWYEVDNQTGITKPMYSEHKWMTNVTLSPDNLHELCNLGARKRWGIEDSNNTEKNRGYHYTHAYSYHWKAMKCFHFIMRMAHAINAISEFGKTLKKYIKQHGCQFILDLIKETLFGPWLDNKWLQHNQITAASTLNTT